MKKYYLIFIVILMMLLITEETFACKCQMPNVEKAFKKADVVFSGEVIKLDPFEATFKVHNIWKGKSVEEIVMLTGTVKMDDGRYISEGCNYHRYANGEKYLIYAYASKDKVRSKDKFRTTVCSRSKELKSADEDIKELEKLKTESETANLYSRLDVKGSSLDFIQTYQPFLYLTNACI